MFNETTKIFDAINTITSLFRGNVFFSNSELHLSDDRPREPIALFTNSNVKDGVCSQGI
jgi:predicted phage tail protein